MLVPPIMPRTAPTPRCAPLPAGAAAVAVAPLKVDGEEEPPAETGGGTELARLPDAERARSKAGTTMAPLGKCITGMGGVDTPTACVASSWASSTSSQLGGWIMRLRLGTPRASLLRISGVSS